MKKIYEVTNTIEIEAPTDACYRMLCDFEEYYTWTRFVKDVEVIQIDDKTGRPLKVAYFIHIIIPKTYRLVLEYKYEDDKYRLNYTSRGGDISNAFGYYQFRKLVSGKTLLVFSVNIDFGRVLPAQITNLLSGRVMNNFLSAIKIECERRVGTG